MDSGWICYERLAAPRCRRALPGFNPLPSAQLTTGEPIAEISVGCDCTL